QGFSSTDIACALVHELRKDEGQHVDSLVKGEAMTATSGSTGEDRKKRSKSTDKGRSNNRGRKRRR
ncbi:MAG TPA: hypothetical protein VF020_02710, partial [Chthoniobacterales bacterium]